jgi:hypothetical protein
MGYVVVKGALGQAFLRVRPFSLVSIILPVVHIHSSLYHRRCIIFVIDNVAKQNSLYYNI